MTVTHPPPPPRLAAADVGELEPATASFCVGDSVRIKAGKTSVRYGFGSVAVGDIGRIVRVTGDDLVCDFDKQKGWHGEGRGGGMLYHDGERLRSAAAFTAPRSPTSLLLLLVLVAIMMMLQATWTTWRSSAPTHRFRSATASA